MMNGPAGQAATHVRAEADSKREVPMKKAILWSLVLVLLLATAAAAPVQRRFTARLTGDQEVPPVATDATGRAAYRFNADFSRMRFVLHVKNIEDVVAAHVHCGAFGESGPVGVTLFSGGPVSIQKGILVASAVSTPDAGNACGWETLEDVWQAMLSGDTYDNVHTLAHPSGEIRGQIK